jgi:hypothetical protein
VTRLRRRQKSRFEKMVRFADVDFAALENPSLTADRFGAPNRAVEILFGGEICHFARAPRLRARGKNKKAEQALL